jgi:AcrR family transcriptional regulator
MSWTERAADRSPIVQRWRSRNVQQMQVMVDAAKRLITERGGKFTTQELAAEAGVAMQTFYRHFGGKDQLLLAALEDMHTEEIARWEQAARGLPDPVARLRYYVTAAVANLDAEGGAAANARFVTAEHWRLHMLFPEEMAHANQPFADLLVRELRAAQASGLLPRQDADQTAELMAMLIRSAYHHYAFAATDEPAVSIAARVWKFCLAGISGNGSREQP